MSLSFISSPYAQSCTWEKERKISLSTSENTFRFTVSGHARAHCMGDPGMQELKDGQITPTKIRAWDDKFLLAEKQMSFRLSE